VRPEIHSPAEACVSGEYPTQGTPHYCRFRAIVFCFGVIRLSGQRPQITTQKSDKYSCMVISLWEITIQSTLGFAMFARRFIGGRQT
jgi:hypothetical protein